MSMSGIARHHLSPAPPSVIPKSRYATSVWLEALLDKYWGVENNGVSALTAPSDSEAGENVSIHSSSSLVLRSFRPR